MNPSPIAPSKTRLLPENKKATQNKGFAQPMAWVAAQLCQVYGSLSGHPNLSV